MKKAILIVIAFIYAVTCIGVSLQIHICKGEVVAISIQEPLNGHRCCDMPKMKKDCCKDITKIVKLEHAGLKYIEVKLAALSPVSLPSLSLPVYDFTTGCFKPVVSPHVHAPPLLTALPRYLTLGVFLV